LKIVDRSQLTFTMTPIRSIVIALTTLSSLVSVFAFHSPMDSCSLSCRQKIFAYKSSSPRSLIQLSQSSDDYDPFGEEEISQESYVPPPSQSQRQTLDPLVASLTRVDETASSNIPTRIVPLFGEVPADGNLALLVPAAIIGVLGVLLSIVVAFNARDAIVDELSQVIVDLPKMEYTETVVEEGVCRGLCSSQEADLEGLRDFMQSLAK